MGCKGHTEVLFKGHYVNTILRGKLVYINYNTAKKVRAGRYIYKGV